MSRDPLYIREPPGLVFRGRHSCPRVSVVDAQHATQPPRCPPHSSAAATSVGTGRMEPPVGAPVPFCPPVAGRGGVDEFASAACASGGASRPGAGEMRTGPAWSELGATAIPGDFGSRAPASRRTTGVTAPVPALSRGAVGDGALRGAPRFLLAKEIGRLASLTRDTFWFGETARLTTQLALSCVC